MRTWKILALSMLVVFSASVPLVAADKPEDAKKKCLSCHGPDGSTHKDLKVSKKSPHPDRPNCLECHENHQMCSDAKSKEIKADAGAAGTPKCLECHGPKGTAKKKSKHPDRPVCLECHDPSAGK